MLHNYFILALRNLRKHPGYALLNILGLALGTAGCLLIGLYVGHERSYDRFLGHADRIVRVVWAGDAPQTRTPHPMALALARDFPEVEHAVSLSPIWGPGLTRPSFTVRYADRVFEETGLLSVDSTFFEVFDFPVLAGDRHAALRRPGGVVLTRSTAAKYFGDADPLGQVLRVNGDTDLFVTAVVEDVPEAAHFHFDFLVSYVTMKQQEAGAFYTWSDFGHYNYLLLRAGADVRKLEAALPGWVRQYLQIPPEMEAAFASGAVGFRLQPLTEIHLHSNLRWELEPNGNIAYVWLFSAAALLILLIACANFINLITARSAGRAREIGVRKVLGAGRRQVMLQFLAESLLVSALATGCGVALVELLLPVFNDLLGTAMHVDYGDPRWLGMLLGLILFVGVVAGSYPAFILSALPPVQVLKGRFGGRSGAGLRRVLVVGQFAVSVALLTGTFVVDAQLRHLTGASLGFADEQVLVLPLNDPARAQYDALRQALARQAGVLSVAGVSNVPGDRFNRNPIRWRADTPEVNVNEWHVDYDALDVLGLAVVAGRAFERDRPADVGAGVLINETAARTFDGPTPVGQMLTWYDDEVTRRAEVLGVVRDFHFQSLHQAVEPMIIQLAPGYVTSMLVRLRPEDLRGTLAAVERTWAAVLPQTPFAYTFLDARFDALYRAEQQTRWLFGVFSLVAVLLACLGLFSLTAFTVRQRTKEIGVRKVLGASVPSLVLRLSAEFVGLVLVAFCLAAPVAWWIMQQWLAGFAYRIEVGAGLPLLAGLLALGVALLTVGGQALRAAQADPVQSLRYE